MWSFTCTTRAITESRFRRLGPSLPLQNSFARRSGISAGFARKSFAELTLRRPAQRMLVASRVPVNPARDFFLLVFFAVSFELLWRIFSSRVGTTLLCFCGDEGNRTPDLLLAKQALYQLSYIPDRVPSAVCFACARTWIRTKDLSFIRAAL